MPSKRRIAFFVSASPPSRTKTSHHVPKTIRQNLPKRPILLQFLLFITRNPRSVNHLPLMGKRQSSTHFCSKPSCIFACVIGRFKRTKHASPTSSLAFAVVPQN